MAALMFGACGPTKPPPKAMGEPCSPVAAGTVSEECSTGLCVALDTATGFCTDTCQDDSNCPEDYRCEAAGRYGRICKKITGCHEDGECPSGHSCNPETGNCYLKVQRTLCSPCQDTLQCPEGGTCFTAIGSGEQFCTTKCGVNDACPVGFECSEIPAGPEGALIKQCVPKSQTCSAGRPLCSPCRGDEECGGYFDLCVRNVVSGEQFCGRDCDPDRTGDCPAGFSCVDIGQGDPDNPGPFQCVPNANTCVGYCDAADERGQIRECGLGQTCNVDAQRCEPATDGRMCAPCTDNDDCRSGGHPENRCIVNDCQDCPFKGEAFCSTPCADDAACVKSFGPGFVCKPVEDSSGATLSYCMPQRGTCASGLGRIGDDCSRNGAADCVAGVCLHAGITEICSAPCSKDFECGDERYRCCEYSEETGYDCSAAHRVSDGPKSGSGVCAPMGGLFGDDCTPGRPPCQTGACLDVGTARVCTSTCAKDEDCPGGFTCREAAPLDGSANVKVCFPVGGGSAGADCSFGPAACESGLCIRKDSGSICTLPCELDADCPESWVCNALSTVDGQPVQACVPPALQ
ncbi:MAG: hypothetical protein IRZ16_11745 [Myxococcaceae bacterium]|nr:hypothetical protein [Myxococcaceae bacterium]